MKSWKVEIGIRDTMAKDLPEEIKVSHLIGEMTVPEAKEKADEIGLAHSVIGEYLAKHPNPGRNSYYRWQKLNNSGEPARHGKYISELETGKDWKWWFLQVSEI